MKKVKLSSSLLNRIIHEEKEKLKIEKNKKALLEKKRLSTYIRLLASIQKSQKNVQRRDLVLENAKKALIKKIKRSL
jgi:hypothetical protein